MADIASLGIRIETNAQQAQRDLASFRAETQRVGAAAVGMDKAVEQAATATERMGRTTAAARTGTQRLAGDIEKAAQTAKALGTHSKNAFAGPSEAAISATRRFRDTIADVLNSAVSGGIGEAARIEGLGGRFATAARQTSSALIGTSTGVGAVTAALAVGTLAWAKYDATQREAARTLTGWGKDAGLTVARLNEIADAAAKASNLSLTQARATVGALAGTGRINPAMLAPIQGIQRDLAATLATDAAEANRLLAASFSDPIRGAEMLNERLGGLTHRTRDYIAELVASGRQQQAQQVLLDTFAPRLGRAAELTGFWARKWMEVSNAAADAFVALGRVIDRATTPAPAKSFLQEAEDRLKALQSQAQGMVVDRTNGRVLGFRGGAFGPALDAVGREDEARKRVTAELEIQKAAMHAIRIGQETLNMAVERQAGIQAEIARQRRAVDAGTDAARTMGLPGQADVDRLRTTIDRYRELLRARDAPFESRDQDGGLAEFRRRTEAVREAQRALRDMLQDNGRGVFDRYGNLLLENNQIIERRLSLQDQLNQRTAVERQGIVAVTREQQASAAAAREIQNAREQGASAGSVELVMARALAAAETVRVGINHQLVQAARDRAMSTRLQIDAVRAETAAMGGSVAEIERVRLATQLINDAKREYARLGLQMPQAEIDHYRRLADEMGRARQAQAELRAMRDVAFDRQTMFLPDADRQIATQMRSLYGDEWQQNMNGAIAQQMRFNAALKEGADYAVDFAKGFTQDIRNGVPVLDALGNAFLRVGQKIIDSQIEQMIRSLFGQGGIGNFNLLGSFFSLLSGGGGAVLSPFGRYANGAAFAGGNVIPFARGGVVSAPTLFPMANGMGLMGEAGPEGVLPLKRNSRGQLGVIAQGGMPAIRGGNVTIINKGRPVDAKSEQDANGDWTITLDDVADQVEGRMAQKVGARRGPMAGAIGSSFGIPQNGGLVG